MSKFCVALLKEHTTDDASSVVTTSAYDDVVARRADIRVRFDELLAVTAMLEQEEAANERRETGDDAQPPPATAAAEKTRIIVCTDPFEAVDTLNAAGVATRCTLAAVCSPFDQEWKAARFAKLWGHMSRGTAMRAASGYTLSVERACEFYLDPDVVFPCRGGAAATAGGGSDGSDDITAMSI